MKKYSSIVVQADHQVLVSILDRMKQGGDADFQYDDSLSREYAVNIFVQPNEVCCFKDMKTDAFGATIWLYIKGGQLTISNIVADPKIVRDLSVTQYNTILNDFFHNFMSKFIDDRIVNKIVVDGENVSMKQLISEASYKKLLSWVNTCNQDNPISHDFDEKRWFDFLISICDNGDDLSAADLINWLEEDRGWTSTYHPGRFDEIANAYEYGLALLRYVRNV